MKFEMAENLELFERRVSRLMSTALPLQGALLSHPAPFSLSPGSLAFILCFQRLITPREIRSRGLFSVPTSLISAAFKAGHISISSP